MLELFAGTRSIGKAFEERGHEVFSVEWNKDFENIDLYKDIGELTAQEVLDKFGHPDVVWMSYDCTSYSIAGISHHRKKNPKTGNLDPISNQHCLDLVRELKPTYWFIENPVGGLRKMSFMQGLPRYTVTYCQYTLNLPPNQRRKKPTDIFTNHPNPKFKLPCKNGDPCHVAAPRGSRTGTQGIKGSILRSVIPHDLCYHIATICEEEYDNVDLCL